MVTTSEPIKVTSKQFKCNQCPYCSSTHYINQCPKFSALNVIARIRAVNKLRLCFNCLSGTHVLTNCRASTCRVCKGKHHTLLHKPNTNTHVGSNPVPTRLPISTLIDEQPSSSQIETTLSNNTLIEKQINNARNRSVFLTTAQVLVRDKHNNVHKMKAFLDNGSQENFITENAAKKLQLNKEQLALNVIGFNEKVSSLLESCDVTLHSLDGTFTTNLSCFITPIICTTNILIPNVQRWHIPSRYKLADDEFNLAQDVDLLIGGEIFFDLLLTGKYKLGPGLPVLRRSRLGWIVTGSVQKKTESAIQCKVTVETQLKKFWEIEEGSAPNLPYDEKQCEDIFLKTHTHNSEGNFEIELPLKQPPTKLGQSRHIAYRRFKTLESKFERNPEFKDKYVNFMREFEQAGHMIQLQDNYDGPCNFLPHQAVFRDSPSTPIRIVFDCSCRTDNGISLNDIQYKGSIIQDELINILLRFRKYQYVINADIQKMYRCIYVKPNQQYLQCIFWRENTHQRLQIYMLTTLSFGLKSAPHIATRCLLQLSNENQHTFPAAAEAIANQFYMDDFIAGGDDENQVAETASQVNEILRGANFTLRKWKSNSEVIIKRVSETHTHQNTHTTEFGDKTHKVLGLAWSSDSDELMYTIKENQISHPITKRKVLGVISSIFDPLGLTGPVIVVAKIFIQKLFKAQLDWDTELTQDLIQEWNTFYRDLFLLNQLKISRCTVIPNYVTIQIHGFCDSSIKAYGAAIYIRSSDRVGNVQVHLLYSKSKISPIQPQTIPNLELCSSLLLATHVGKIKRALKCDVSGINLWSDSKITLCWIKNSNPKLTCFVSNRVTKVLSLTNKHEWSWVRSEDNPADLLSRGVAPGKLETNQLWWSGPAWLTQSPDTWPTHDSESLNHAPEAESDVNITLTLAISTESNDTIQYLFHRWSSDKTLIHVLAYILRFIYNTKNKTRTINPNNKLSGPLSVEELKKSDHALIRHAQMESFPHEYKLLQNNKPVLNKSKILSLHPFMKDGLVRVGGRIGLSHYAYEKKHPLILSHEHALTKLLMANAHIRTLHAGPQLLLSTIRERIWPTKGRMLASKIVNKCVPCFRANPKTTNPIMGNLPPSRVNPSPPFAITGIDYGGPYNIRDRTGRGYKVSKCYIAVFICFATKAIHLELITGLESANFLAALRRFIARRGKPKELVSDNSTTFHGASNELKDLQKYLQDSSSELVSHCADEGIKWSFIPVYTPHMGSLWESSIKLTKYHLKRVLGLSLLTYEQFVSILYQVESMVNSRPLCPLPSSNPDYPVLTPAHFLIGKAPNSLPDEDYNHVPKNRLTHYQLLQQITQDFWRRWSRDYIGTLQERTKWRSARGPSLAVDTVVLVRDERLPPCRWRLGKIVATQPGRDGVTRVAVIRTARGDIQRAFNNICPLPTSGEVI
ncbi:uncharacterized protein LOC134747015 isoform X2 [Cydia strobilella]